MVVGDHNRLDIADVSRKILSNGARRTSDRKQGITMTTKAGFTIRNLSEHEAEICLYDVIDQWGGISAKDFRRELKAIGSKVAVIHVRIHSPGGSVWDGMAIYSMLRAHAAKKIVHIDGLAASMASVIAMAGDEVEMPPNAFLMIDNPVDTIAGEAEELRKTAELLDDVKGELVAIYARKTGQAAERISVMMDEETWIAGGEAVAIGFCDRCTDAPTAAASIDPSRLAAFRHVPGAFRRLSLNCGGVTMTAKAATIRELRAACPGASEKFLCEQLEAEATVASAALAWMVALADCNKALESKVRAAKAASPGVIPPKMSGKKSAKKADDDEEDDDEDDDDDDESSDMENAEDAIEDFDRLVARQMKLQNALQNGADRMKAVAIVANKHPALHRAYLIACNGGGGRVRRLMAEKFEGMPSSVSR
jgi:ATP-dependent protease ClpP protease subunit